MREKDIYIYIYIERESYVKRYLAKPRRRWLCVVQSGPFQGKLWNLIKKENAG